MFVFVSEASIATEENVAVAWPGGGPPTRFSILGRIS
jgi:hypothetical protein